MSEIIALGFFTFVLGLAVGTWLSKGWFLSQLRYKAETEIDLNEDGTFYTIRFSERNE